MWSAADCVIKMYELCNFIRPAKLEQIREESWSDIQKQLKEMTDSTLVNKTLSHPFFTVFCDEGEDLPFFTQVGFEKERALLITRATVAEAQVSELQDYIDNHLVRSGSHLMCKSYNVHPSK